MSYNIFRFLRKAIAGVGALGLGTTFYLALFIVILISASNVLVMNTLLVEGNGVAETINVAGKLRMLSQKIGFGAAAAALHPDETVNLDGAIDDYEAALTALENGGTVFGLTVTQVRPALRSHTETLRTDWSAFRRHLASPQDTYWLDIVGVSANRLLDDAEALVKAITLDAQHRQVRALSILEVLFVVEAAIFGVLILAMRYRIVSPLLQLVRGTRGLAEGRYGITVDYQSRDEVGELVEAFNFASRQIGELIEQIKTERENLREAESMFRSIAENPLVGVYVAQDNRFLFVNQILADMFQYEREHLQNHMPPLDLFTDADKALVLENIRRRASGEVDSVHYEVCGQRSDGSFIYLEIFGSMMKVGGNIATLGVMLDVTTRRDQQRQLEYLAQHDSLTGLANRNLLGDRIQQTIAAAKRQQDYFAVLLLDLDYFKVVNDSLGHEAGDTLLREVALRLVSVVREGDTVARFGGDEFVVLMPDLARTSDAAMVANKIQASLAQPFTIFGQEIFVSASIGIALYPQDGDAESLIKHADLAMYRAKSDGRNSFWFYSEDMDELNKKRMLLERELRHAIESNALRLEYQPKVCLKSGRIVGAEALLRWQHAVFGAIAPSDFIPLAEETGLIVPIGNWVLRTACAQAVAWRNSGLTPIKIAVNVSGKQLRNGDLVETLRQILQETGLAAHYLELELTESILMEQLDDPVTATRELKALGVQLAMDDFGTGYSSLNYLKLFPFDSLKLDRSFISDIATAHHDGEIVKAVIALGHILGLSTVAEGVESAAQLAFLRSHHCAEAQGYLFSHALSPEQFTELLHHPSYDLSAYVA